MAKQPIIPKMPIAERVEYVVNLAVRTGVFFDIWWLYRGPTRADILQQMNACPDFFRFDEHAHLVSMIIHLAVLHDKRGDTLGFETLIEDTTNSLGASRTAEQCQKLLEAYQLLTKHHDLISRVRLLRHKAFAHRDASQNYNDVFREADLKPNELKQLIDDSRRIANKLAACLGLQEGMPDQFAVAHARRVLDALKSI